MKPLLLDPMPSTVPPPDFSGSAEPRPESDQSLSAQEQAFIAAARQHCLTLGTRLTPLRTEILLHLRQHPGGIKAYNLLSNLQAIKPGIAPMSIYRTLDFLVGSGLVHKVDATSSFIVCEHGHHDHHDHGHLIMLICERCGRASEICDIGVQESLHASLNRIRTLNGFHVRSLEIKGICSQCVDASSDS